MHRNKSNHTSWAELPDIETLSWGVTREPRSSKHCDTVTTGTLVYENDILIWHPSVSDTDPSPAEGRNNYVNLPTKQILG